MHRYGYFKTGAGTENWLLENYINAKIQKSSEKNISCFDFLFKELLLHQNSLYLGA